MVCECVFVRACVRTCIYISRSLARIPAARAPAQRIAIESGALAGNLNLRGARLDDLVLLRHRETTDPGSAPVRLFASRDSAAPYFAQWGWTAADGRTRVPDTDTDWTADGTALAPGRPVAHAGQMACIGLRARVVPMSEGEACIDADKPVDIELIEAIFAARRQPSIGQPL